MLWRGGFSCVDKEEKEYHLPYPDSDGYIAIPPADFEALMNYCNQDESDGS